MQRAIFSKTDLQDEQDELAQTYLDCVNDIVHIDNVQELKEYSQHLKTSRFQHSLNVSYYSFLLARKLHLDERSTARAGLLHDLYYYDWRTKDDRPMEGNHCSVHPQIALENARRVCEVNDIMEDAILHHMWPMTMHTPKTKEGWVVQAMDKYCALSEILLQGSRRVKYSRTSLSLLAICSMFFTTKP